MQRGHVSVPPLWRSKCSARPSVAGPTISRNSSTREPSSSPTASWRLRGAELPRVGARTLPLLGDGLRRPLDSGGTFGDGAEGAAQELVRCRACFRGVDARGAGRARFRGVGAITGGGVIGVLDDLACSGGDRAWTDGHNEIDNFLGDGVDGGTPSLAARERNTIRPTARMANAYDEQS